MTARDEAIEAAARHILRDIGHEPRDDRPIRTGWLALAEGALTAALPALLNDLADRIEADVPVAWPDDRPGGIGTLRYPADVLSDAIRAVRAAAEGWGA